MTLSPDSDSMASKTCRVWRVFSWSVVGSEPAISLARALTEPWQHVVLGGAAIALFALRRGVVPTLLAAAAAGIILTAAGLPLPH